MLEPKSLIGSIEIDEQANCDLEDEYNFLAAEEKTLDPKNWDELEKIGHQMVSDMMSHFSTLRERPAWQPMPENIKKQFEEALPTEATDAKEIYNDFKQNILPYPAGNIHPRFWGWVLGTGTPYAMLADMLASGMNTHASGHDQAALYVESQVISWLREMLKFPNEASGLLVTGGSMANIIGLTIARNHKAPIDIRKYGLQGIRKPLTLYCSTETHSWIQKATELLGLGTNALRRIPVNQDFQINIDLLKQAIRDDKAAGLHPFCIIGTVGTTNTGAIDELEKLAEICKEEDIWFHIDGAFGSLAVLSEQYSSLVSKQNLADSIAFDLHKWMYMPFDVGCILVKDSAIHANTFKVTSPYLEVIPRGLAAEPLKFSDLGVDLTRGFRALKLWMSIKIHGAKLFGQLIEQNINQARYLTKLIYQEPNLQLLAPTSLNIVCFRYASKNLAEKDYNDFNQELLLQVQESGIAVISNTTIKDKFALRAAITNHRSCLDDFNVFIKSLLQIASNIEQNWQLKATKSSAKAWKNPLSFKSENKSNLPVVEESERELSMTPAYQDYQHSGNIQ